MCPRRDWFREYKAIDGGEVLKDDNKVIGIRNISIMMAGVSISILNRVGGSISILQRNLISIDSLDESSFVCNFEGGFINITKGSLVVMKWVKQNGIYVL